MYTEAPSFHIIDQTVYHTDLDTLQAVPAYGLEQSARAFAKIIDEVNGGKGTIGKFLKDPTLYDNANKATAQANQLITEINSGKGTLGRLAKDEALAKKIDATITRLNSIADKLDEGKGTAGKFVNDPSLYDNADKLLVETRKLIADIRRDPKTYLTIHLKLF